MTIITPGTQDKTRYAMIDGVYRYRDEIFGDKQKKNIRDLTSFRFSFEDTPELKVPFITKEGHTYEIPMTSYHPSYIHPFIRTPKTEIREHEHVVVLRTFDEVDYSTLLFCRRNADRWQSLEPLHEGIEKFIRDDRIFHDEHEQSKILKSVLDHGYLKNQTGLFLVTPIIPHVNGKTSFSTLGNNEITIDNLVKEVRLAGLAVKSDLPDKEDRKGYQYQEIHQRITGIDRSGGTYLIRFNPDSTDENDPNGLEVILDPIINNISTHDPFRYTGSKKISFIAEDEYNTRFYLLSVENDLSPAVIERFKRTNINKGKDQIFRDMMNANGYLLRPGQAGMVVRFKTEYDISDIHGLMAKTPYTKE